MILIGIVIVIIGCGISIYLHGHKPKFHEARQKAVKRSRETAGIVSVDQFYLYNGSKTYYTVVGTGKNTKRKSFLIPDDKKEEIIGRNWADGISKKHALNKLREEKHQRKCYAVRLGYESVGPVWEISYLDDRHDLNYFYHRCFKTGEWWRKIENI